MPTKVATRNMFSGAWSGRRKLDQLRSNFATFPYRACGASHAISTPTHSIWLARQSGAQPLRARNGGEGLLANAREFLFHREKRGTERAPFAVMPLRWFSPCLVKFRILSGDRKRVV